MLDGGTAGGWVCWMVEQLEVVCIGWWNSERLCVLDGGTAGGWVCWMVEQLEVGCVGWWNS